MKPSTPSIPKYLLLLTACMVFGARSFGQDIHIPTDSSYYKPLPMQLRDSYFYFQGGGAFPLGLFGQQPDPSATVMDPFQGNTGSGAALGYALEVGFRRGFIAQHAQPSRIYPFWGVAFGGAYTPFDWTDLGGYWQGQNSTEIAQVAGLVHLGVAFKHKARWVFECHTGLLLPAATFYPDNNIEGSAGRPTDFSVRAQGGTDAWAPGVTAGITWRTRRFRIGAEWFRHRSTVSYTYWDMKPERSATYDGFFDWQTARAYIGFQF